MTAIDTSDLTPAQANLLRSAEDSRRYYASKRWASLKAITPRGTDVHSARALVRKGYLTSEDGWHFVPTDKGRQAMADLCRAAGRPLIEILDLSKENTP